MLPINPAFRADAFAAAQRRETPYLTQDGRIWPVRRGEMRYGPAIRDRMREDLQADAEALGYVEPNTLHCLGYTPIQIETHGEPIIAELLNPAKKDGQ